MEFHVTYGWLALIFGVILIFQKRLGLENRKTPFFLVISSLLIVGFRFQDVDYFLSLYDGVTGEFDVDIRAISRFPSAVALATSLVIFWINTQNNKVRKKELESRVH